MNKLPITILFVLLLPFCNALPQSNEIFGEKVTLQKRKPTYAYRSDGIPIAALDDRSIVIFDSQKRVIESIGFDASGNLRERIVNVYSRDEKTTETFGYDAANKLTYRTVYTKDSDNKLSMKQYDGDGKLILDLKPGESLPITEEK